MSRTMENIENDEPVDGFNVEPDQEGNVTLALSNRYGKGEAYVFPNADAERIGRALIEAARAG